MGCRSNAFFGHGRFDVRALCLRTRRSEPGALCRYSPRAGWRVDSGCDGAAERPSGCSDGARRLWSAGGKPRRCGGRTRRHSDGCPQRDARTQSHGERLVADPRRAETRCRLRKVSDPRRTPGPSRRRGARCVAGKRFGETGCRTDRCPDRRLQRGVGCRRYADPSDGGSALDSFLSGPATGGKGRCVAAAGGTSGSVDRGRCALLRRWGRL